MNWASPRLLQSTFPLTKQTHQPKNDSANPGSSRIWLLGGPGIGKMSLKSNPASMCRVLEWREIESAFASRATLTFSLECSPGSFYIQFLSKGFRTVCSLQSKTCKEDKTVDKSPFRETTLAEKLRACGEICAMAHPHKLL